MTMLHDQIGVLVSESESNAAVPVLPSTPEEPRAPTAGLSPAKRAALIACFNGGSLHKRDGAWAAPSASTYDKPVSGVTVADLGRDGMLMLSMLDGNASARLTTRGSWFVRTMMAEIAERAAT